MFLMEDFFFIRSKFKENYITDFKQNYQGDILYNDINIKDISSKSLHQNVTLVSQDTYLL